jgi:hypothetical protein
MPPGRPPSSGSRIEIRTSFGGSSAGPGRRSRRGLAAAVRDSVLADSSRYAGAVSDAIKRAVANYAAAWAERDPARRAALLESAVTDDVRIVIGAGKREIRGRAAFEAEIVDLQRRVPVLRVRVASGIDVQGNLCRFTGRGRRAAGSDRARSVGRMRVRCKRAHPLAVHVRRGLAAAGGRIVTSRY